jgi:hypothetical protein
MRRPRPQPPPRPGATPANARFGSHQSTAKAFIPLSLGPLWSSVVATAGTINVIAAAHKPRKQAKSVASAATGCLRSSMVRRGSPVRVRKRALQRPRKAAPFLFHVQMALLAAGVKVLSFGQGLCRSSRRSTQGFFTGGSPLAPSPGGRAWSKESGPSPRGRVSFAELTRERAYTRNGAIG